MCGFVTHMGRTVHMNVHTCVCVYESHIDSMQTVGGFCQQNIICGHIIVQCILTNLQYVYKCTYMYTILK